MKTPPSFYHLTHSAQLFKLRPNSLTPDLLKKAKKLQDDFRVKLSGDPTKTPIMQELAWNESGVKQAGKLISFVQDESYLATESIKNADKSIEDVMKMRGTTDTLILSQTAQALLSGKFSKSKLRQLASEDVDIARSILITPLMKIGLGLDNKEKDYYKDQVAKHTLDDEYDDYKKHLAVRDAFDDIGSHLMEILVTHNENVAEIKEAIKKGVVLDLPTINTAKDADSGQAA